MESREAKKRKEWMRISIRVWWRKIKRKGKKKEKKETYGRKKEKKKGKKKYLEMLS